MCDPPEKGTGIGGIFFRARDPERLTAWYREHLGIAAENGFAEFLWHDPQQTGRNTWALFPADTDYFGLTNPAFMINYRVANLEKMLAQLRRRGVTIEKVEDHDYGRFAWLNDPEGNRIELWEPKSK